MSHWKDKALKFWDRGYFVQKRHLIHMWRNGRDLNHEIFNPLPLTVVQQMEEEALYFYIAMYVCFSYSDTTKHNIYLHRKHAYAQLNN